MSIVYAAIKGGEVAIAADTQTSYGSLCVSSAHLVNSGKLFEINDSIVGLVGWGAIEVIVEHLLRPAAGIQSNQARGVAGSADSRTWCRQPRAASGLAWIPGRGIPALRPVPRGYSGTAAQIGL